MATVISCMAREATRGLLRVGGGILIPSKGPASIIGLLKSAKIAGRDLRSPLMGFQV